MAPMPNDASPPDAGPAEADFSLETGTTEHYEDAVLYDFEYRRRRVDVHFYRGLASEVGTKPILELGCGTGRVLVPLVRDGRRVMGVDRSLPMLRAAQGRLARVGKRATHAQLLRSDFRALGLQPRFALALCPFNTLQHVYTRQDLEQVLAAIRAALEPGGRFAFDVMNPDFDWLMQDPRRRWARTRFRHPGTGEALVYSTNHLFDRASQINYIRVYYESVDTGQARVVRLTHRLYFPAELEALLHYNGFTLCARFGDFGYGPLTSDSEQQICIAEPR